ncbi:hypothetical protein ACFQY7_34805 [Actinomadura luteofluorescens]|uniref:Uncharacterized protein n=1 Tax=Actinomadura luteofluorescens TaxID=46163 RepID=A0A7Y9JH84_9ACTN|nr:hypothetical protein [Actinomadura luteofluorescens]NYD49072.1 hypothetical protein [Actinomadura luteofluorescens]
MTTRTPAPNPRPVRRTRRTRPGYRLAFADRFMLAGSTGGAVYLFALHLAHLPTGTATAAGVLVFVFALGVLVTVKRLPHLRPLLEWRPRR